MRSQGQDNPSFPHSLGWPPRLLILHVGVRGLLSGNSSAAERAQGCLGASRPRGKSLHLRPSARCLGLELYLGWRLIGRRRESGDPREFRTPLKETRDAPQRTGRLLRTWSGSPECEGGGAGLAGRCEMGSPGTCAHTASCALRDPLHGPAPGRPELAVPQVLTREMDLAGFHSEKE